MVASIGCGSSDPSNASPILGPLMPQVLKFQPTGLLLTSPKVLPITFAGDANATDISAFFTQFAQSTAWATQTAEYGIGPLTVLPAAQLSAAAPPALADGDLQTLLTKNLTGAAPAWGPPDPSTIYAFFVPAGSIVDDGTGAKSCDLFDGYHAAATVGAVNGAGGVSVAYFVVVQCPGFDGPDVTDLQQLTVAASHETIEAVTDPSPDPYQGNPAYLQTDDSHIVWSYTTGGEIADMCEIADTFLWTPPDMTYAIQRVWSNAAAAAGHDPCVGQPTTPYYQTVPEQNDEIALGSPGNTFATKGIHVALGQSGTVTLHVYADAAAGPFDISFFDYNNFFNGGPTLLAFTAPTKTVKPGDTVRASVKVMGQDPTLVNGEAFLVATIPASGPTTLYFGLVGQ